MNKLMLKLKKDQKGLSTMEYAVLFVIIVVGAIALWSALGQDLATRISKGTDTFKTNLDTHQDGTNVE